MIGSHNAAVSANNVIETIGSYSGLASIIGLGVLSLLYFTQAREVKRLREWAGRSPERAAESEQRAHVDAQRRVVAKPLAPATIAAQQSADASRDAATAALYASLGQTPPGSPAAPGVPPAGQLARSVPPAQAPGSVPGVAQAQAQAPGSVPGVLPAPAQAPGSVPGVLPAQAQAPGSVPGVLPAQAQAPGSVPGVVPAQAPGSVPGVLPAQAPGSVPGVLPAQAPGSVPGALPAASPPGSLPFAGTPGMPTPTPKPSGMAPATPTPTSSPASGVPRPATPPPGAVTVTPQLPAAATAAAAAAAAARQAAPPSRTASTPYAPLGNGSTSQDTAESDAAKPEPLPSSSRLPGGGGQDRYEDDDGGGYSSGRIVAIAGGAIAAILVAVVLMVLLSGDDSPPKPNDFGTVTTPRAGESNTTPEAGTTTPAPVDRKGTDVAVLNGTTRTGLARNVADKLEASSFTIQSVGNNTDQQVPTTIVSYKPGNERAAQAVAKVIGIDAGAVQTIDATAAAPAEADVVVTVGNDQLE